MFAYMDKKKVIKACDRFLAYMDTVEQPADLDHEDAYLVSNLKKCAEMTEWGFFVRVPSDLLFIFEEDIYSDPIEEESIGFLQSLFDLFMNKQEPTS